MNSVQLIGNLGRDVELRKTASGRSVANFRIAVNGARPEPDWFSIVVWGDQADLVTKYLHKGSKVGVTGRLQTSTYTDKSNVQRTTTEIIADRVDFLGGIKSETDVSGTTTV